jgi:hypothetical protein
MESEFSILIRDLLYASTDKEWDNYKVELKKVGCDDGRWMELAQDRVQWQALVLAVLNLRVLLSVREFV